MKVFKKLIHLIKPLSLTTDRKGHEVWRSIKLIFFSLIFTFISCQNSNQYSLRQDVMKPVPVQNVKVGGEIGRRIDVTINNNLLKLNLNDDFLAPFQLKDQDGGYIGMGKLIDASVKLAYYSQDAEALKLKEGLIHELIKTQGEDGYIGTLKNDSRMWKLWDVHEMGYIVLGLVNDYRYFKNQQSLNSSIKLANYIIQNWSEEIPESWVKRNIAAHMAIIGLDRALLALYSQTQDSQYLDFLTGKLHIADWDLDIVVGRRKLVEGHIYAYLTRCLAQLELYHLQPDEKLLNNAQRALNFLTKQEGMLITGGAGQWECWTDDQDGGHAMGETCATAYQMRLYEKLFRMKGNPCYGDLIERTIYNALFAAQSPDGRNIRYYTPLAGKREYFERDTYCCPNNYRRIIGELPSMIYYKYNQGLAINLYTESEIDFNLFDDTHVLLKQITDYPGSDHVKIIVSTDKPAQFPVYMRIPSWARKATVSVNDNAAEFVEPGSMFGLTRMWTGKDTIRLNMPMEWDFVKGRRRQAGRVAIKRGPVVYCLNPGLNKESLTEGMNPYELGRIIIDPKSIKGPFPDNRIRPNGTKCVISAWKEGHGLGGKYNFELTLSEFIDPDGENCYFSVRDFDIGIKDNLLNCDINKH